MVLCGWKAHKKPLQWYPAYPCICSSITAFDFPFDDMIEELEQMGDHISNGINDSTKRAPQVDRGKSIKQFIDVHLEGEHVSQRHFEELTHMILQAMGSPVPKLVTPPMVRDIPSTPAEKTNHPTLG